LHLKAYFGLKVRKNKLENGNMMKGKVGMFFPTEKILRP
jgi:hypothetical protein